MQKPKIKIDVVSDVVCPWCYIGKRRLERAIEEVSDKVEVILEYHPFELNPDMPEEGRNQKQYLANKFGGEERYQQLTNHVTGVAAQEGLQFDYPNQKISPNTRDAHRLIWFAKKYDKHIEMKEALMKAYFTDGVDLTKKDNLALIASQIGLDAGQTEKFLSSSEGRAEVMAEEMLHTQRGISGVPFYIVNNKYGISGAQPSEVFAQALLEISNETITKGEACDVDTGEC